MTRPTTLVLGTRGSPLALWQARHVSALLERADPGLAVDLTIIRTEGDRVADRPFGDMPGRGFFVKEIEDALLERRIDLAVHSLKDLPTEQPRGLSVAAVLPRHDPRDALLSVEGWSFAEIPGGTVVATGSPRRRSQLLHARPDLGVCFVRGNVDTRILKLREGQFGAMVLALAGVERLGISEVPIRPIPIDVCLPAVGQGAVAVETRDADDATRRRVTTLTDPVTLRCALAERAFLSRLGGGCLAPAAAHARIVEGRILVDAMVGDPDGRRLLRSRAEGNPEDGCRLAEDLADGLLAAGGDSILRDARLAAPGGSVPRA
jgi:hydroxymethylbilane synthase